MIKAAHNGAEHRRSFILRTIYALCLLGATYNHIIAIIQHGIFWDYGGFSEASSIFWTLLTIIDPTTVILLFVRPNAGITATVAIIIADVIHNVWITAQYFPPLLHTLLGAHQLIEQIIFLVFVVITAHFAWVPEQRADL